MRSTSSTAPTPSTRSGAGIRSGLTRRRPACTSTRWRAGWASSRRWRPRSPADPSSRPRPPRGARRGRHRRRPLPQHLAGRRAGRARHGPQGRPADDGPRALADLPDAPALEVRPEALRRPDCIRCCLAGRRPPQAWRYTGAIDRALRQLDALIFPSRARAGGAPPARDRRARWSTCPTSCPTTGRAGSRTRSPSRPRGPTSPPPAGWCAMKGFQRLIPMMKLPARGRPPDRRDRPVRGRAPRAGRGPAQRPVRGPARAARPWPGSSTGPGRWSSRRSSPRRSATSSSKPSPSGPRWSSTRAAGPSHETGVASGGGLGYRTDAELLLALRRIVHDDDLRDELAHRGYAMRTGEWSEAAHLDRYFGLIQGIRSGRIRRAERARARSGRETQKA